MVNREVAHAAQLLSLSPQSRCSFYLVLPRRAHYSESNKRIEKTEGRNPTRHLSVLYNAIDGDRGISPSLNMQI